MDARREYARRVEQRNATVIRQGRSSGANHHYRLRISQASGAAIDGTRLGNLRVTKTFRHATRTGPGQRVGRRAPTQCSVARSVVARHASDEAVASGVGSLGERVDDRDPRAICAGWQRGLIAAPVGHGQADLTREQLGEPPPTPSSSRPQAYRRACDRAGHRRPPAPAREPLPLAAAKGEDGA